MGSNSNQPDEILEKMKQARAEEPRGHLHILFGYAPGVGKTYSMLLVARAQAKGGRDVVVGYVEPHGRKETEALLEGLEILPMMEVEYRGLKIREFDLDAALARKPNMIVLDELAHTNAPVCRHAKRWQDAEELMDAGINVYTTLNVQHLESLNDVMQKVTGVVVRETIPDHVFDSNTSVIAVDLAPEELLQRLSEGKVYVPTIAERAMERFFKSSNLHALREIALRRTADRVSAQAQTARMAYTGKQAWPTHERLLVCIGPSPTSARVIRTAKRLAASLKAPWAAVCVETPQTENLSAKARTQLFANMRLAEELGAEIVTLSGHNAPEEILRFGQARNITKIIIGKTGVPRWRSWFRSTLVDELLRESGDIDIYVVRGAAESREHGQLPRPAKKPWWPVLLGALVMLACTAVDFGLQAFGLAEANKVMVYLFGIVLVAAAWGRRAALASACLAVLLFDFCFVPPYYTFAVSDTEYVITFAVMLIIGGITGTLTARVREQAALARAREERTRSLYRLSQDLAARSAVPELVKIGEEILEEVFNARAQILLGDERDGLAPVLRNVSAFEAAPVEYPVAQWVLEHGKPAGMGTSTLPAAHALYLPLKGTETVLGVLHLVPISDALAESPEERHQLDAFVSQIAGALERERLLRQSQETRMHAEAETLRSSLLSSISHDLRTPLAVIAGATSTLLEEPPVMPPPQQQELLRTVYDESRRLSRLVDNVLNLTRVESGMVQINKEWQPVEEVIGSALHSLRAVLAPFKITVNAPEDSALAPMDGVLIEQVLINLLENAAKYAPGGTEIILRTVLEPGALRVQVEDRGPGVAPSDESRLFEKFFRGAAGPEAGRSGAGLGLAICRAIIAAHGGRIAAANRPGGGLCVTFWLPRTEPPELPEKLREMEE